MNTRKWKSAWIPWAFLAPYLVVTLVFLIWPLGESLRLSLHQTFGPGFEVWVGLDNFRFLLGDPLFWKAVRNTSVFAAFSVFLQLPLSLGLACLLNRPNLRGRALFRLIFFSPSLVGLVFVGVLFSLLFEKRTGFLNRVLAAILPGFDIEFPWLESHVMAALVLAALWLYVGFNMIYFLAALQNVPEELMEAATLDGASAWQRFRHVVLPEILPVASFVVLLSLLGSFQLFELPFILLSGAGPDNQGLTVVMYLYNMGFVTGDLGYASAIGWLLALLLMAFAFGQRWLVRRSGQ
jgi:ABC-type sugar transport system permease subunit